MVFKNEKRRTNNAVSGDGLLRRRACLYAPWEWRVITKKNTVRRQG